ncbi:MAG: substrate-binding domain-containing protein [Rhodospirillaceae bacterium]|nr:substrate-binding domain-containing protein [Rhodospirillaceae bacterium]
MSLTRRQLGLGLLGGAIALTGGGLYLRDHNFLMKPTPKQLFGFIGGEKKQLLSNERVKALLADKFGLALDARQAGSVEMVREEALLAQKPQFLWPSSDVMVELAKQSKVKIQRSQVIVNSPIVIYSWEPVAQGLMKAGIVTQDRGNYYITETKRLLQAHIDGGSWASVNVPELYGKLRILSTDPNRSNSGFMFAGLAADILNDDVATLGSVGRDRDMLNTIFRRMGFMAPSSGKLFEDYLVGGMGAYPLVVGYESQLLEWSLADPGRWERVRQSGGPQPVMLYPTPTVFSAHPLIAVAPEALTLIDALQSDDFLGIAWTEHGFRGPLGAVDGAAHAASGFTIPQTLTAIVPMPDADVMLSLTAELATAG